MQPVLEAVTEVCRRPYQTPAPTVLLIGEAGTGKSLIARTIHYDGARRAGPFIELRCGALPPWLLARELFGHEGGAKRIGLFETARGGTLFLDEIASLPLTLQARLAVALETGTIRRESSRARIPVDVQVISTAQPTLRQALDNGHFRRDLFERAGAVQIELPPLRERGGDKLLLAESLIRELCLGHGMPVRRLAPDARRAIVEYPWPGNVRELRSRIQHILAASTRPLIRAADFELSAPEVVSCETGRSGVRLKLPEGGVALHDLERELLREALTQCGWNVSAAARFLRISRYSVMYRMRKYKLGRTGACER